MPYLCLPRPPQDYRASTRSYTNGLLIRLPLNTIITRKVDLPKCFLTRNASPIVEIALLPVQVSSMELRTGCPRWAGNGGGGSLGRWICKTNTAGGGRNRGTKEQSCRIPLFHSLEFAMWQKQHERESHWIAAAAVMP